MKQVYKSQHTVKHQKREPDKDEGEFYEAFN